ncbi:MAG: NADPH2:quinone reductase [Hyphomicrobiaceae bacterium]|jgi:NADPH2:quinone reductase
MRAVVCKEFGPPESLVVEEIESPELGAGQVRIAVEACGVNFPDTLIIENKYQFKPPLPFSPGGEVAGSIVEVGSDVEGYDVGDRVIAMTGWGGFAQEVLSAPQQLMRIPDGMDAITAAGFTMTYGTSHYALKQRAALRPGETVLVLGAAGGVGLAAVDIAVAMGAKVIAAASTQEKLDLCREYGAESCINYTEENLKDRVKELTGGVGVDVVYDPVGGELFEQALRATAWGGRVLVIGFASGKIPQLPANLVLLKSCQVVGVFWGAFTARDPETNTANLAELAAWHREGKIRPLVSQTYPLERAGEALRSLLERRATGKVILTTGD